MEKVYLSVGRHAEPSIRGGIEKSSFIEAFITGKIMKMTYPSTRVYCSPTDRAYKSGLVVAESGNFQLVKEQNLREERWMFGDGRKLLHEMVSELTETAKTEGLHHLHLITHLPVLIMCGFDVEVAPDEYFILEAPSWDEMYDVFTFKSFEAEKVKTCRHWISCGILKDSYPERALKFEAEYGSLRLQMLYFYQKMMQELEPEDYEKDLKYLEREYASLGMLNY